MIPTHDLQPHNWHLGGVCTCGNCGYEDPDCAFYLSFLCKDSSGTKDPNFDANDCINCQQFYYLCGTTCNFCLETTTKTTTTSTSTTSVNRGNKLQYVQWNRLCTNIGFKFVVV